ncbi:MAG: NAD(P)/FAD-dependent oxidoreductase [Gallionellaceae bacterium]|nr:NAD(P)/FAD-dependent oxidoreductase [Gallionellaceae bacterium]
MLRLTEIKLPLGHPESDLKAAILKRLGIAADELIRHVVFKRGVDARKKNHILFTYTLDVEVSDEAAILERFKNDPHVKPAPDTGYHFVAQAPQNLSSRPVVIGMGPAGLFTGLILAQMGFRPLILERGKAVRERTKDTFGLWRQGVLDPESNVQFGEGGAGTFSDGKLYSQIKDPRYLGRKVLEEFVKAGAPEEILYVSHPHIGTFRLVGMVEKMRETIQSLGGEIRFGSRVDDIEIENGRVCGVTLSNGERIATNHLVLAVGHSARDTFEMIHRRGVYIEAKPFSIGFRIEHPQSLIDRARYGSNAGNPQLGAADYKLVHHASNGRSVYSFCMCPGGTVVAATSEAGRVVTNGMSQYSRNERNANSGIVVGITPEDYPGGPLAGIEFQRRWESRAFELGGGNYQAPGQLVGDFLAGRPSKKMGAVQPSYTPGVHLTDLSSALPDYAVAAIREALPAFARQIKGFDLPDAVLTGVETRTSSPVRIKRNDTDLQSINTQGLYPTGEGAGYAGGILSAAVDGIRAAEAVALSMVRQPDS